MPTYILQPGHQAIAYPDTCLTLPADLPSCLAEMKTSFRHLLSVAVIPHGRDPELIIDAFTRHLVSLSPQYNVPYWQIWKFGPGKWPYGKWVLDRLVRFIADEPKLIHALAELEQEPWARSGSIHSIETIEIDLGPDEEPVPWRRVSEVEL